LLILEKKLSKVLTTYFLVKYIIIWVIYSAFYDNLPEYNHNLFSLIHVYNSKQLTRFIMVPIQYTIDFFMIGYFISWEFKHLFQEIFSINKIKKTFGTGIILLIAFMISLDILTLYTKIPHLISVYFTKINPYYFIFSLKALILAPLFEEIIYRGIIYNSIKHKYGVIVALIVSALIFGLAHVIGRTWAITMTDIYLGFLFAYVYEVTDQLCWPIALHSFLNLIVAIKKFS